MIILQINMIITIGLAIVYGIYLYKTDIEDKEDK